MESNVKYAGFWGEGYLVDAGERGAARRQHAAFWIGETAGGTRAQISRPPTRPTSYASETIRPMARAGFTTLRDVPRRDTDEHLCVFVFPLFGTRIVAVREGSAHRARFE